MAALRSERASGANKEWLHVGGHECEDPSFVVGPVKRNFLFRIGLFLKRLKGAQLDRNVIARVVRLTAGESALFRSGILQVARRDVIGPVETMTTTSSF